MPKYLKEALHKFHQNVPQHPQDAPHSWNRPTYGTAVQYAISNDISPLLPTKSATLIQKIVGTLLYCGIVVDPIMLVALGSIASHQSKATEETYEETLWLLNYVDSHPDTTIRYHASDVVLHIHSDASNLLEPQACSRAGGHYSLSDRSPNPLLPPRTDTTLNGPIFVVFKIMSNVMASSSEAEIGSTFINGQEAVPILTTLRKLGHPQPATPLRVNNSAAEEFANNSIKQKRSKAIDMRFYWIKDREIQGQFLVYWKPGRTNLGGYHTKHHLIPPYVITLAMLIDSVARHHCSVKNN